MSLFHFSTHISPVSCLPSILVFDGSIALESSCTWTKTFGNCSFINYIPKWRTIFVLCPSKYEKNYPAQPDSGASFFGSGRVWQSLTGPLCPGEGWTRRWCCWACRRWWRRNSCSVFWRMKCKYLSASKFARKCHLYCLWNFHAL